MRDREENRAPPLHAKSFAVLIAMTSPYYRPLMEGVLGMARQLRSVHPVTHGFVESVGPAMMEDCDGVISALSRERSDWLASCPFPCINVSNSLGPHAGMLNYLNDDTAVGRLGAEHLLRQGYRSFACLTQAGDLPVHRERVRGFRDRLAEAGHPSLLETLDMSSSLGSNWTRYRHIRELSERLHPLLNRLSPDTGVFTTNDEIAWILLHALRESQPELLHTVGVLGVDNVGASAWVGAGIPELSSVLPAFHEIGREALKWLDAHPGVRGRDAITPGVRRFPPAGVLQRGSTTAGGCTDPMTARMIRWAAQQLQAGHPASVADLASHFHMSRKTVYRHFLAHAGEPPAELLDRMRLEMACHLLRGTRLSIGEISDRCHFAKQDVLTRLMRREMGLTPREYRSQHPPPPSPTVWPGNPLDPATDFD